MKKIRELQQSLGITSLYVTHDQTEAFAVSDEVIVMNKGKIMQKAPAKSFICVQILYFLQTSWVNQASLKVN